MIRLVFSTVSSRKTETALFILALCLILIITSATLSSLSSIEVQIEEDITQYARGSYDLLVRPQEAITSLEEQWGLVEENYLSVGRGGISIADWQSILALNDVEVAAPVASLGYFKGVTESFSLPMPEQSARIQIQFFTTDGMRRYPLYDPQTVIYLEQDGLEYGAFDFVEDVLPELDALQFGFPPSFMIPDNYHFLVAVDPKQEEKLTGISFQGLYQDISPTDRRAIELFAGDAPIINMMNLVDPHVPISVDVRIEYLEITSDQVKAHKNRLGVDETEPFLSALDQDEYRQVVEEYLNYPARHIDEFSLDFSSMIDPFEAKGFRVTDKLTFATDLDVWSGWQGGTSEYFLTEPLDYVIDGDQLFVGQKGTFQQIPVYRHLERQGGKPWEVEEVPFVLHPVGSYHVGERENQLAASPLGIYQLAPPVFVESGAEALPTITPGSFVPAPAHGVVKLEDAAIIKGHRPINAIRVRVAGIEAYTDEAVQTLKEVAATIHQMGFHVDIVAGASHRNILVDVENVGLVQQPWTTLGAATSVTEGWSLASVLITVLFIVAGCIYVVNRMLYWKLQKKEEVQTLLSIGWQQAHIQRFQQFELMLVLVLSGGVSLLLISYLRAVQLVEEGVYVYLLSGWIVNLLILLSMLMLSVELKPRNVNGGKGQRMHINRVGGLVRQNLRYYSSFILSSFLQLTVVSALSLFIGLTLLKTHQLTGITNLGAFINDRIFLYYQLILVGALGLALLTMIESQSAFLHIRKNELQALRDCGWAPREIFFLILKEISLWSLLALLLGHGSGLVLYSAFYSVEWESIWLLCGSLIILYLVVLVTVSTVGLRFVTCREKDRGKATGNPESSTVQQTKEM